MSRKGITRREFLKGSAATAVTAAAMGLLTACSAGEPTNSEPTKTEPPTTLKWNEAPAKIAEDQINETVETEVLVVGGGCAGLFAAASAAENGAKVMMIEKLLFHSTERHWLGAVGSRAAKEAGVDFDKRELVEELMKYASCRADQKLIQLWADRSGETIDWLADLMAEKVPGTKMHMEWDIGHGSHGSYKVFPTMHNLQNDDTQETVDYFVPVVDYIKSLGVEIRYETPLVQIERQEGGRVSGVIAQSGEKYIRINASKGVILCCGGYSADKEMLKELNPTAYKSITGTDSHGYNTGDGIKAAVWIGAARAMALKRLFGLAPPRMMMAPQCCLTAEPSRLIVSLMETGMTPAI